MKKLLFSIFLTGNAFIVFAQINQTITYGISGGTSEASFFIKPPAADRGYVYGQSAAVFSLGLFADIPFSDYFSVRPSLFYQGMGSEVNEVATYDVDDIYKLHYIEVPVALVGHWPIGDNGANIFIGGGPFLAFALNGTVQSTVNSPGKKSDVQFGSNGDFKETDFGVTTLLGFQTAQGFSASFNIEFGINNILQKSDLNIAASSAKTNTVYFSIGQSF